MLAAQYSEFGSADVVRVAAVDQPTAGKGQVLVKVHASAVSGGELLARAGKLKMVTGKRFPIGLGNDFAGEVSTLGSEVSGLEVGQPVWGMMPHRTFGAIAEFVSVAAPLLAPLPRGVSMIEAAAMPSVGTTAVKALIDIARLKEGDTLLVRGAAGGVGSLAVELGKSLGAHVTALVRSGNIDWIRSLGADDAFDYATTSAKDLGKFDVIVDAVGTGIESYRRRLNRGGRFVMLAVDADHLLRSMTYLAGTALLGPRRARGFSNNPGHDDLVRLADLVESGALRPVVSAVFPLDQVADAHRALERGGVRGRYVVQIL